MRFTASSALIIAGLSVSTPATAYPIDCAILLCLSGGWPASTECSAARAEFIRRITPFPVEPPLQIWRCPLQAASFEDRLPANVRLTRYAAQRSSEKVVQASVSYPMGASEDAPQVSLPWLQQASDQADIDISGPEFDFVRSIKVWNVLSYSHQRVGSDENGGCQEQAGIQLGSYSTQGAYSWTTVRMNTLPPWLSSTIPRTCAPPSRYRGVGIEWSDFEGNHDFEIVRY